MSMSAQERERIATAIRAAEAKTSGEIVCVLAHSSSEATALPVSWSRHCTRGAVAAGRRHRDVGPPHIAVADHRISRTHDIALPAKGARRSDAARGAPRGRPSRRHGAVRRPRHRAKTGPHRHLDLRLPRRALCPHRRRRGDCVPDAAIAVAGGRRCACGAHAGAAGSPTASSPRSTLCGDLLATNFPRTETTRDELPDRIYLI